MSTSKNKIILAFLCLAGIIAVAVSPEQYISAFYGGLLLFYTKLFPLLFPFFFLCGILSRLGVLEELCGKHFSSTAGKFGLSTHFPHVFLLSILSGYPMNAKLSCDLFENFGTSKQETENILFSTSQSGVMFVCSSVGIIMLGSLRFGVLLLFCHTVSCFLGFLVYEFFHKKSGKPDFPSTLPQRILHPQNTPTNKSLFFCITDSMHSSITSIALVCGYVCIFAVISCFMENLLFAVPLPTIVSCMVCGVLEMTLGISQLALLPTTPTTLACINSLLCFGGISINLQCLSLLSKTGISQKKYLELKIVQGIVGFLFGLCFFFLVF